MSKVFVIKSAILCLALAAGGCNGEGLGPEPGEERQELPQGPERYDPTAPEAPNEYEQSPPPAGPDDTYQPGPQSNEVPGVPSQPAPGPGDQPSATPEAPQN